MVMKSHPIMAVIIMILFAFPFFGAGCSHTGLTAGTEVKQYQIKRLLLMPITNSLTLHAKGETVLCPLCGTAYTTETVESNADLFLTDRVKSALESRMSINVIPADQYQAMRNRILSSAPEPVSERGLLAMIGRDLNAEGILTGVVYLFKNRVGYDYAAESPAAIGFHLDLIDTQSGKIIWSRRYEETQQALSENLFGAGDFFKRKGKWLTVEDLADSGLEKALETIPIPKEKN